MQVLRRRKGAGTLIFFVILLPIIFLLGSIMVDVVMFAMVRTHIQNVVDTALISAVNLSIRDEYRSDRELVIFRTEVPEKLPEDLTKFADNFEKMFVNGNLTDIDVGSVHRNTNIETNTALNCDFEWAMLQKPKVPLAGNVKVAIDIKIPPIAERADKAENIDATCKVNIKLPLLTNIVGFFGVNNPVVVNNVTLQSKVGNIRVMRD